MSLISSLLDIVSSQDVPFRRLQQLHSKHHGATLVPALFCYNSANGFVFTLQRSFLHCYLSVMLFNKHSIATNEA